VPNSTTYSLDPILSLANLVPNFTAYLLDHILNHINLVLLTGPHPKQYIYIYVVHNCTTYFMVYFNVIFQCTHDKSLKFLPPFSFPEYNFVCVSRSHPHVTSNIISSSSNQNFFR
jgi:hypothetical protein